MYSAALDPWVPPLLVEVITQLPPWYKLPAPGLASATAVAGAVVAALAAGVGREQNLGSGYGVVVAGVRSGEVQGGAGALPRSGWDLMFGTTGGATGSREEAVDLTVDSDSDVAGGTTAAAAAAAVGGEQAPGPDVAAVAVGAPVAAAAGQDQGVAAAAPGALQHLLEQQQQQEEEVVVVVSSCDEDMEEEEELQELVGEGEEEQEQNDADKCWLRTVRGGMYSRAAQERGGPSAAAVESARAGRSQPGRQLRQEQQGQQQQQVKAKGAPVLKAGGGSQPAGLIPIVKQLAANPTSKQVSLRLLSTWPEQEVADALETLTAAKGGPAATAVSSSVPGGSNGKVVRLTHLTLSVQQGPPPPHSAEELQRMREAYTQEYMRTLGPFYGAAAAAPAGGGGRGVASSSTSSSKGSGAQEDDGGGISSLQYNGQLLVEPLGRFMSLVWLELADLACVNIQALQVGGGC